MPVQDVARARCVTSRANLHVDLFVCLFAHGYLNYLFIYIILGWIEIVFNS